MESAAFCSESACWFDEVYLFESIKELITKKETLAATQVYYTGCLSPRHRVDLDLSCGVDEIKNIF